MILFYNPKATRPRNRRFPLSILSIAAVVEGKEEYAIVDGNLDPHPTESLIALHQRTSRGTAGGHGHAGAADRRRSRQL